MSTNDTTDATRAHIDAETLAAWAEHSLPAETAAAVELHLSHCDRCQEVLAAFVRSAPTVGAVVIPFWARRPVQWSAAGLAAAAALVAFVWVGRPPSVSLPESTIATASTNSPIQPIPSSASAPAERRADKPSPRALPKAAAGPPPSAAVLAAPPPPPPPAAALPPPVMSPPVTVTAAAPVVTPLGATAGGIAAMAESVSRDALGVIEIVAPDITGPLARRAATTAAGRGAGGRSELNQSSVPARWRVVGGTRVERSTDAGASWVALPMAPVLTTPLVAGVATSQVVCWFVGAEGVVLVTTDGRTLRRVSLPESVRLTGVAAVDGVRATVTAADGRKFSTVDGGLTWK